MLQIEFTSDQKAQNTAMLKSENTFFPLPLRKLDGAINIGMGCQSKVVMGCHSQWDVKAMGCQCNGMSRQSDAKAKGCQSKGISQPMGCQGNGMSKQYRRSLVYRPNGNKQIKEKHS